MKIRDFLKIDLDKYILSVGKSNYIGGYFYIDFPCNCENSAVYKMNAGSFNNNYCIECTFCGKYIERNSRKEVMTKWIQENS